MGEAKKFRIAKSPNCLIAKSPDCLVASSGSWRLLLLACRDEDWIAQDLIPARTSDVQAIIELRSWRQRGLCPAKRDGRITLDRVNLLARSDQVHLCGERSSSHSFNHGLDFGSVASPKGEAVAHFGRSQTGRDRLELNESQTFLARPQKRIGTTGTQGSQERGRVLSFSLQHRLHGPEPLVRLSLVMVGGFSDRPRGCDAKAIQVIQ